MAITNVLTRLAVGLLALAIGACGGGGSGGGSAGNSGPIGDAGSGGGGGGSVSDPPAPPPPPPPAQVPAAPTLAVGYALKQISLSWTSVPGATYYRLFENPDGHSGFVQRGTDIAAPATGAAIEVAVHKFDWANARYLLLACNSVGCSAPSDEVGTTGGAALAAIGYIKASNTDGGDRFGYALALSGDGATLAVGAYFEDSAATGIDGDQTDNSAQTAGAVYVFTRDAAGTWLQQAYIKASDTDGNKRFGNTLSLSRDGTTLAVGAIFGGAVYLFRRSAAGSWSQHARLTAPNATGSAVFYFGHAVALSGDGRTLAVGAYIEDGGATGIDGDSSDQSAEDSGAVYVFFRDASGLWSQQAYVKASNTFARTWFGYAVALSADGDTLAVGSPREGSAATGVGGDQADRSAFSAGAVYLFARSAGATWSQRTYVKASNTGAGDNFGHAVALSADGDTLAVGAPKEDSAATGIGGNQSDGSALDAGAVYLFSRVTAGGFSAWIQQAYVKATNTAAGDQFGDAVALNEDGTLLVVGAPQEAGDAVGLGGPQASNAAPASGAVHAYLRAAGSSLTPTYIKAPNAETQDYFGWGALALSEDGNTLAIGAWGEDSAAKGIGGDQQDNSARDAGAVYLY